MVVLEWTAQLTCRTPPGVERSSGPSQRGTQSSAGSAPEISHHHSYMTPITTVTLHLLTEPFTYSMTVISWLSKWNQPPPQSHYTCLLNHSHTARQSSADSANEISHHHSHITHAHWTIHTQHDSHQLTQQMKSATTTVTLHLLTEPFTYSTAVISWLSKWNQPPPQSHYTCSLNHSHTAWQSSAGSALQPSPQSHYSCSLNHLQKELVFGNKDSHKTAVWSASRIHRGTFLQTNSFSLQQNCLNSRIPMSQQHSLPVFLSFLAQSSVEKKPIWWPPTALKTVRISLQNFT